MNLRALATPVLLAALLAGCAAQPIAINAALHGDPAHPALAQGWVDTRLYFGLGPADQVQQGVSEQAWREFLDREWAQQIDPIDPVDLILSGRVVG